MSETETDGYSREKGFFKIPCSRTAFMTGVGSGLVIGLAHFMFTSRVKRSADVSVLSFGFITLGAWCVCRYDRARKRLQQKKIKENLQHGIKLEKVNNVTVVDSESGST
ncbi:cytochrome c oxidase assembly protein COX20, mitochondrial-like [Saccoglossus kowalevskii]|uniref:Cytochrome c oxidase assembly protein COX20, mitochondrial n=1 Tax=Saccoglossus kowalevskii TaxID=10224 RepID=A0ABM0GK12_SACKO|nr:PREDICTED: cytochrome c oxidase protein 20 homolog [Saccoglossus kowalevskii]